MNIKNEVLYRVYIVLFGLIIPFACLLIYKTIDISFIRGDFWRSEGKKRYVQMRSVEAERGNILAEDGSLLATSLPFFDIAFDPSSSGMSEDDFYENIDSLSYCLATYIENTVHNLTAGGYRDFLIQKREEGSKYIPIKRNASFSEQQLIRQFPLFNLGQFKGGYIAKPKFVRKLPFGILAHRTIGSIRETAKPVGLEGYFDKTLKGEEGQQLMVKVDADNDIWMPLDDLTAIEPKRGDDIITTIDINIQDIAENALIRAMNHHQADWGTAIVMEVETGAIRGIANIGKTRIGGWFETYNYGVGYATEPGSTFKLASIMALMEDGVIDLEDTIQINYGKWQFYEEEMVDATRESFKTDSITIRHALEISSNVGIAKLVDEHYRENKKGAQFIKRLKQFKLNMPTGIEIQGEAEPYVKEAYNKEQNWSGTTLPWMSIGYEVLVSPLQMLTFYNAVANDGMMMKPYLVKEIQRYGENVQHFVPTVVDRHIASKATIRKAHELLLGVVENGTAHKLKTSKYKFAGKTGTAQKDYRKIKEKIIVGGYQASFAGFFPAQNPKYSCIVVINDPQQNGFYGGDVAGPVFREIADKIFATKYQLHDAINEKPPIAMDARKLPDLDAGNLVDIAKVLHYLDLPYKGGSSSDWTVVRANKQTDSLHLLTRNVPMESIPNVVGMGLRDAMYLLENRGLKVKFTGAGKVLRQSFKPGTRIRGQTITLTLG